LKELRAKYVLFDADGTGLMDLDELGDLMRATGLNPVETKVKQLMQRYDHDKSGDLNFSEFVDLFAHELLEAESDESMFKRAFQFFDADGSGDIALSEFRKVLTELGDPLSKQELEKFFELVDADGDGHLSYKEFLGFLQNERQSSGGRLPGPPRPAFNPKGC